MSYCSCGCHGGWSQPTIPLPIQGVTSYTAPFAGALARPFADKFTEILSLGDFGFAPTNTPAGNRLAWTAAMAAMDVRPGGKIIIPAGTYTVDTTLIWPAATRDTWIAGDDPVGTAGAGGVYLRSQNLNAPVLHLQNTHRNKLSGVKLGYTGNGSISTYAMVITDCTTNILEDLSFFPEAGTQIGNGLLIQSSGGPEWTFDLWMERCRFTNITQDGLVVSGADAVHWCGGPSINRCSFFNCGRDGVRLLDYVEGCYITDATDFFGNQRAVHINATSVTTNTHNVVISGGAVVDGSTQENIRIVNAVRVMILGAWVSFTQGGASVPGIFLSPNTERCVISGCAMQFHGAGGILCEGHHNLILGNAIYDNPPPGGLGYSINLGNASHDNVVVGNASHLDPLVNTGTNNVIGPNTLNGLTFLGDLAYRASMQAGHPALEFDGTDYLLYDRTNNRLQVFINGIERLGVDPSVAVDNTSLLLWDVNSASMKRVVVGAANSGGAGFRMLRIVN